MCSKDGRLFFESNWAVEHLAVHLWQDLQLIASKFIEIACNCQLYQAVMAGNPIDRGNYDLAISVADNCLSDLRVIINGNSLSKFEGTPCCVSWFQKRTPTKENKQTDTGATPKRQKTSLDDTEIARRKGLGLLVYDATAGGTTKLPNINVYATKRGSKTPERICARFLIRDAYCSSSGCKYPHVTNIDTLSDTERGKLIEFVKKTPGLAWAPGKAPPGAN